MSKFRQFLKYDAWIILLDIFAVNAAYFLALCIRFYVNFHFVSSIGFYLEYYFKFVPFYTIICLIVFSAFKLYGGMWTYAGLNDMNRIIVANITTAILQIAGTRLFIGRMPTSYYMIGSFLQFLFTALIRFSYRFIQMEKKRLEKRKDGIIPSLVVGSGDYGRKVVHHLEDNTPYRAVVIAGQDVGRNMDGIPVVPVETIEKQIKEKGIKAVFIADKGLSKESRDEIKQIAQDLEFSDFTGFMSNESGFIVNLSQRSKFYAQKARIGKKIAQNRSDIARFDSRIAA